MLKKVIFLYANTNPAPIQNLREISKAFLNEDSCTLGIWAYGISSGLVHQKIELIIGMQEAGIREARKIYSTTSRKDAFFEEVNGYPTTFPPELAEHRLMCDEAFYEVYGYGVSSLCPCSFIKSAMLCKNGYVTESDDLTKAKWTKPRISCLECDHLHFITILKDLSQGIDELTINFLSGIVSGYGKECRSEEASFTFDDEAGEYRIVKLLLGPGSYRSNDAAFPSYLGGLPCNMLVDLLSSGLGNEKRIKQCTECSKFFFAKDAKRTKCYDDRCFTDYKRRQKASQRDRNPVKYV